jgi:hypothetical protein
MKKKGSKKGQTKKEKGKKEGNNKQINGGESLIVHWSIRALEHWGIGALGLEELYFCFLLFLLLNKKLTN